MPVGNSGSIVTKGRARISAVVACVPKRRVDNSEMRVKFGDSIDQVTKMTGVKERRKAGADVTTADLCVEAAKCLTEAQLNDVDALIFVSQTPDYRLPATACVLQSKLALRTGIIALDVNLGCSGYPYALWLGTMMIDSGAARKVLLLVGDTITKLVEPSDRATAPLFGDCGTATLLEPGLKDAFFVLGTDGRGGQNLIVPGGAFRDRVFDPRNTNPDGTLFMDGTEVFNFTLKSVPLLMQDLVTASGTPVSAFDRIYFHQANEFMINHLRKKIGAEKEQTPVNIGKFGNTSSASIPLLIADFESSGSSREKNLLVAMLGFGVGFSWAAAAMSLHADALVQLIEYPEDLP